MSPRQRPDPVIPALDPTPIRPTAGPLRRLRTIAGLIVACSLASAAAAGDLQFGPPQFLPGDTTLGLADGHQEQMEIAAGAGGSLAVWSDMRSSLDEFQGLDGSGMDVYGALLDGSGDVIKCFTINEGPGDQTLPHVAWNGSNWLVAWMEPQPFGLPTYERICGVRVAPDGTLLDATPIVIHVEGWGCYCSYFGLAMAGGADGWVVVFDAPPLAPQGIPQGLMAIRVQADGSVANPSGLIVQPGLGQWGFDVAFAQDEYMIVYSDGLSALAKRYSPTLQYLGATTIPFAREVATDGTDFLVVGQWDYSWPPKLEATLLGHDGSVLVPRFTVATGNAVTGPSGERVGFGGSEYWVAWAGDKFARVTPAGQLLDPEGFTIQPAAGSFGWEPAFDVAPGGGIQIVWHDGGGGIGYPEDVYTAQITPAGQSVNQTPISVSAPAQVEPDFAAGDGIHMIVFRSRSSGAARILAQRLDDAGGVLDPEPIEVASGPVQWLDTPSIDAPQVAWNGSVFLVAWSDTIDVLARRMHPDGTFIDATPLVIMPGQGATVGALDGTFLVGGSQVVYSSGTLQPPGALRVSRVDGVTGAVLDDPPIMVGGASDRYPHIVTLGGRWLVVWESVTYDPWSSSVFYAAGVVFVEADGTTTDQLATGLSRRPNVAVSGDRALLVAVDATVPGGYTDLEARILMADGSFQGPKFPLSTAFDEQLWPAATWDGTQFLAAWEDKRDSVIDFDERTDIYGTRVTATGVVRDPTGVPLVAEPAVEIRPTFLTTDSTTAMAVSTLRSDDPSTVSFRLGIHALDGLHCQPDLGFGGPGSTQLSVCGSELGTGGSADLSITGAPPDTSAWVTLSAAFTPTPFKGGTLVPLPLLLVLPLTTDGSGAAGLQGLPGGGGPLDVYVQAVVVDPAQPKGYGLSNALQVQFLP
jgi:hypothetical protein